MDAPSSWWSQAVGQEAMEAQAGNDPQEAPPEHEKSFFTVQ